MILYLAVWLAVALPVAWAFSRLKRPERTLKWGGVIQRRPVARMGIFVAGETPEAAAENLVTDARFFMRSLTPGDQQ